MRRVKAVGVAILVLAARLMAAPGLAVSAPSGRAKLEGVIGVFAAVAVVAAGVWAGGELAGAGWAFYAGAVTALALAGLVPLYVLAIDLRPTPLLGNGRVGTHFLADAPEAADWGEFEDDYLRVLARSFGWAAPVIPLSEGRAARACLERLFDAMRPGPDYFRLARVCGHQQRCL
ncbi:MAG: hypothetical protein K2V38_04645, partial [Gemmataceae bacterium]|nr:hypothetical protein [Gemmataceae bacterium]